MGQQLGELVDAGEALAGRDRDVILRADLDRGVDLLVWSVGSSNQVGSNSAIRSPTQTASATLKRQCPSIMIWISGPTASRTARDDVDREVAVVRIASSARPRRTGRT